jgi:hypothetical protein
VQTKGRRFLNTAKQAKNNKKEDKQVEDRYGLALGPFFCALHLWRSSSKIMVEHIEKATMTHPCKD